MYTHARASSERPRTHNPRVHTVVIRFGIYERIYINIYIFICIFLSFFFIFYFICSNPWQKFSPSLIHHPIWIAHTLLFCARTRAHQCTYTRVHTHLRVHTTYEYFANFHIIYIIIIRNISTVYFREKIFSSSSQTTVRTSSTHENMLEKMLSSFFFFCGDPPSIPRNDNNGRHYRLICAYVSLRSMLSLCKGEVQ